MPTYEYQCEDCGYLYEAFHKMSDDPLKECPKCHKMALKRLIGGKEAHLNFKGSGFYITDYVKKKPESKDSGNEKSSKDS